MKSIRKIKKKDNDYTKTHNQILALLDKYNKLQFLAIRGLTKYFVVKKKKHFYNFRTFKYK